MCGKCPNPNTVNGDNDDDDSKNHPLDYSLKTGL